METSKYAKYGYEPIEIIEKEYYRNITDVMLQVQAMCKRAKDDEDSFALLEGAFDGMLDKFNDLVETTSNEDAWTAYKKARTILIDAINSVNKEIRRRQEGLNAEAKI